MTVKRIDQGVIRSGATRMVLEKTDRILGQSEVRVVTTDSSDQYNHGTPYMDAPAWTDGKTITLNRDMEPLKSAMENGFTPTSMAITTALNYHELAHCMFTPRMDSNLVKKVAAQGAFMALNILEDQSAETRFVKLYEPARHYFTSLVTNFMMENDQYLAMNYPLVAGRLFIPQGFRDRFRNLYMRPKNITEIDRLVAEYKTLVWPGDEKEMFRVIIEFDKLLKDAQPPSSGGTPHDKLTEGKPDHGTAKRLVQEKEFVNEEGAEGEGEEKEGEAEEKEASKDANSSGDDDGEVGIQSDSSSDSPDEDDNSSEAMSQDRGGSAKNKNNKEKPEPKGPKPEQEHEDLRKAMKSIQEDVVNELAEELGDRIDSIQEKERDYEVEKVRERGYDKPVGSEENMLVNQCIDAFREVRVQNNPGWHRSQRSGKLDPRQYAKALQGSDQVFRRWKEGINDVLDFEVVFLLDQSGSMFERMETASIALWVLKRTFEESDGTVTAMGFHDETTLLAQRGEKASQAVIPIFRSHGSTYVNTALEEARRILGVSRKPLKLCVVISDGGFHDQGYAQQTIATMDAPVLLIGIGINVAQWNGHKNVIHTETIQDPLDIVPVVRTLALRLSEEHIQRKG